MKHHLEANLIGLKEKLAAVDRKIEAQPYSRHLKIVRKNYQQAINSAERTIEVMINLDPVILNTAIRLKKLQESS